MDRPSIILRASLIVIAVSIVVWAGLPVSAQETQPVGKTQADQERNAELLKGYDYSKYPSALTGYTGQDRQQIVFERREHATRVRVGPRGNYKAGLAELPNGKLVLATCRNNNDPDPTKKRFLIHVYQSADQGLTWQEINETPLFGKEPSLTALPASQQDADRKTQKHGPNVRCHCALVKAVRESARLWPGPESDDRPGC